MDKARSLSSDGLAHVLGRGDLFSAHAQEDGSGLVPSVSIPAGLSKTRSTTGQSCPVMLRLALRGRILERGREAAEAGEWTTIIIISFWRGGDTTAEAQTRT